MSQSLAHPSAQFVAPVNDPTAPVFTRMEFVSDGAGNYTLTTALHRDAGFVVSGSDYVFTPGTATALTFVRNATGDVLSYR